MGFENRQCISPSRRPSKGVALLLVMLWLAFAELAGAQTATIRRYAHDQGLLGLACFSSAFLSSREAETELLAAASPR